jgi:ATP-dependent Clp endopeptidase proteolytic subunit ClpP
LKDRILLLGTEVNDEVANNLVAQLLYLASEDPKADITLYINSPGGSVSAGKLFFHSKIVMSRAFGKPFTFSILLCRFGNI